MKSILKLAAAIMLVSSPASAFTFNDAIATCILCGGISNNPEDPVTTLDVGDIYRLKSGDFITDAGNIFDIGLEVVRKTDPKPTEITEFRTVKTGGFVQYNVRLLEEDGGFGDLLTDATNFLLNIEDIDSNTSGNFTEYAGVSGTSGRLPIGVGDALDRGLYGDTPDPVKASLDAAAATQSFDPDEIPPGELSDFVFAWAAPNDDGNWVGIGNTGDETGNDAANTASFVLGDRKEFNFIWGVSTGPGGETRGWNLALSGETLENPELVPEIDGPVLVQVGFALMGLYVLMLGRRRREDELDMSRVA